MTGGDFLTGLYCGPAPEPADLWLRWNLDPLLLMALLALGVVIGRRGPGMAAVAVLGNIAVYWLMQATLLGTAILFWRAVLHPGQATGTAILSVWAGFLQMALLGALLTLAPDQLYAIHATAPLDWGLTPLGDQQLGGLIMWIPAGLPFAVIGGLIARRGWRAQSDGRA